MKRPFLPLVSAIVFFLSFEAQAMPLTGPHYKPKWTQLPDMVDANDTVSMHRSFGPVVANDFVSDGRVIAGFHWWGSYFQNAGQSAAERDVLFEISFHEDCPANDPTCNNGGPFPYSTPSDGNYFSDIFNVEEDFYGTTDDGVDIYEYWVAVDPNNGPSFLNGTWNEIAGNTYWVDFAWAAGQFGTSVSDDVWGWAKSAGDCIGGCAVTTAPGGPANPHIGPWNTLGLETAFEVITVPEPGVLALFGLGLAGLGWSRRKA